MWKKMKTKNVPEHLQSQTVDSRAECFAVVKSLAFVQKNFRTFPGTVGLRNGFTLFDRIMGGSVQNRLSENGLSQAEFKSVIISNGEDFFEIPTEDLADALSDGFYLPRERGLTIVSNGDEVFEIPIEDVAEALQDGFRDLIATPDGSLPSPPAATSSKSDAGAVASSVEIPDEPRSTTPASIPTSPPAASASDATTDKPETPAEVADVSQAATARVEADDEATGSDEVAGTETAAVLEFGNADRIVADLAVVDVSEIALEEREDAEAERRRELQLALTTAQGVEKLRLWIALHAPTRRGIDRFMRSYGASTLLHVVLVAILWNIVFASPEKSVMHVISSVISDSELEAEEEGPPVELEVPTEATESSDDVNQMQEMMAVTQLAKVDLSPESLNIKLDLGAGEAASAEEAKGGGMTSSGTATAGAMGARSTAISMFGGTPSSEAAVEAALDWLARHQAADGGWGFNHSFTPGCNCANSGTHEGRTGATGIALLTYFGAGYTFADGPRAETIRRGVQFLLESINVNQAGYGDLKGGDKGNGGIYQHGLATAALCEALAVNRVLMRMIQQDKTVRFIDPAGNEIKYKDLKNLGGVLQNACQLATNYLVFHQDPRGGGWGYQPKSAGDTSILGWQVMALISGQSEKVVVPSATWSVISSYLNSVASGSGYSYRTGMAPKKSTTAIGTLCRMYTGATRSKVLKDSVVYLGKQGPSAGEMYYNYYATQAMFAWGDEKKEGGEKLWTKWNDKARDMLVSLQAKAGHQRGSWISTGHNEGGRHFATCLAAMTLEIYYRKLPIYQRLSLEPIKLK